MPPLARGMKRPEDLTSCWLVHGLRQDMADTMRQTRLREAARAPRATAKVEAASPLCLVRLARRNAPLGEQRQLGGGTILSWNAQWTHPVPF